ncbi:hypothetical protein [Streptomyces yaizuensis]|uniref:Uncharacterized protein n=1 Tax=Streptomyces yaizuensis TaxID=2989713 RepID=A0ABQ5P3X6_9ACTN|nr:hypothetical protein [Streptomyces sp. YSPA8]GLF97222.1 hypothetical protein SYYSPA8_23015 [Streptomyces sp. YSPA8]
MYEESAEQQAEITSLLLYYIQAPFVGVSCVRGVLPSPVAADSVRIVTGEANAYAFTHPGDLRVYEIPLHVNGELLTGYGVVEILRALHTGTHIVPSVRLGRVMGMPLIQVDAAAARARAAESDDRALVILRTLVHPVTEAEPDPRLLGFLCQEPDRLRLYLDTEESPVVLAADVRPSGALTALLAALPSLITEEERMTASEMDPHAAHEIDLTYW